MGFFHFYRIDATIVLIIVLFGLLTYGLINYIDPEEEHLELPSKIATSLASGILISMGYSYFTLEKDELLTTKYWE